MDTNVSLRISEQPAFGPYAFKTVLEQNTTILDNHTVDENNEVVVHEWYSTTIDFWMTLLHSVDEDDGECLDAFNVTIEQLWSIVSFYEMYVRPKKDRDLASVQQGEVTAYDPSAEQASPAALKLRCWFGGWWKDQALKMRETAPGTLAQLVIPAFYIGDAKSFMEVTHEWFLHTRSKQSSIDLKDLSDEAGRGALAIHHPMLGKLAAVRSNMIHKIEDALAYDEDNDGLPREKKERGRGGVMAKPRVCQDPDWCPKEKNAAYYTALMASGCWPVGKATETRSVHGILSELQKFDYIPGKDGKENRLDDASKNGRKREDKTSNEHDRSVVPEDSEGTTKKPCNVCIDAAVKASFDKKVKGLLGRMLDEKQTTIRRETRPEVWTRDRVDDPFKGLCLDCLTKTKFQSEDDDYWSHCHDFGFDYNCRVKHGQPVWYFSYICRPEAMQKWSKTKRK